MDDLKRDRIENAIRHIQTATDVDPWAAELAEEALKAQLSEKEVSVQGRFKNYEADMRGEEED